MGETGPTNHMNEDGDGLCNMNGRILNRGGFAYVNDILYVQSGKIDIEFWIAFETKMSG